MLTDDALPLIAAHRIIAFLESNAPADSLLRVPIRRRRPRSTRETLGFAPLVETGWADASSIKRVPRMTALAEPVIFLAGRPAAERAADARRFRLVGLLLFLNLAVWSDGRL